MSEEMDSPDVGVKIGLLRRMWLLATLPFVLFRRAISPRNVEEEDESPLIPAMIGIAALATVVIASVFAVYFAVSGMRDLVRHRKAQAILADAREIEATGNPQAAMMRAGEALEMNPESTDAARFMANVASEWKSPDAKILWQRVLRSDDSSIDDWASAARNHLTGGDVAGASTVVEEMGVRFPGEAETIRVAGEIADHSGDDALALRLYGEARAADPTDRWTVLRVAVLESKSSDRQTSVSAAEELWSLGDGDDGVGIEALRVLAGLPLGNSAILDVAKRLASHPKAGFDERLASIDTQLRATPVGGWAILQGLVDESSEFGQADQYQLARWLGERGEHELVLQVSSAGSGVHLLEPRCGALMALGRTDEVEVVADDFSNELAPSHRQFLKAHVAAARGADQEGLRQTLFEAHEMALSERRPNLALEIGRLARRVGNYDQAEQIFRRWTTLSETRRRAYEELLKLAADRKDPMMESEFAREFARAFDSDISIELRSLYYDLIAGVRVELASARIDEMSARSPGLEGLAKLSVLRHERLDVRSPAVSRD